MRAGVAGDVAELLRLMRETGMAPQWSEAVWRGMFAGTAGRVVLVAEEDGIVGFVAGVCVVNVAEVESIAVGAEARRRGVGRMLIVGFEQWALLMGARAAELEVRASNEAAREFYRALGFAEQGRRPRYYANPVEDGVLMHKAYARGLAGSDGA